MISISELSIREGEVLGLVGNNGAGKTTLLNLMLDLIPATAGEVLIKGQAVAGSDHWKAFTGSYINENFLIPFLKPAEYLEFIAGLNDLSKDEIQSFYQQMAHFFQEGFDSKTLIRDLSLGNKNKVGILGAILGKPELILLDEPFANLDPSSQSQLKSTLTELGKGQNTIVVSSHDLGHISAICTRIIILDKGQVVKDLPNQGQALEELERYFQ
ncbi:MAG: ABC transporter ATP-binding protein [Luteibaculum sp.]